MPAISVIVPVYNSEIYLMECLDSVISQTFQNWEMIIVDDGSTDGSAAICDTYASKDSRIKVIHKENGGFSSARNTGLDNASGDYIFFLDSDDVISYDAFEHLYNCIIDSECDISTARYIYDSKPVFLKKDKSSVNIIDSNRMISNALYQKKHFDNCVWNKLYKSELFDGLRFNDCWFEDLDIFYKLYERAGRIVISNQITYLYRKHDASFIHSWNKGRCDIIGVTNRLCEYMAINHPDLSKAAEHRKFSGYYNLFIALTNNEPDNIQLIEYCLAGIKNMRAGILFDPKSRLRNRVGALLSYFGKSIVLTSAKCLSKYLH